MTSEGKRQNTSNPFLSSPLKTDSKPNRKVYILIPYVDNGNICIEIETERDRDRDRAKDTQRGVI
jgi:hypothetical protein